MIASEFSLSDQYGRIHALRDYRGSWTVVYFYPKDNTPGCTKEACSFRDGMSDLKQANIVVLGISKDSVESHEGFASKYKLNFPILSDPNGTVIEAYGAMKTKSMFGKTFLGISRKTVVIDPNGNIAKVYENVEPSKHAAEILKDIQALSKTVHS